MDRALKERIIGAAVLVAVVVLVVPVFLDGPDEGGETVTTQIGLPGHADGDSRTVVLDRDRDAPMPGASSDAQTPERTTPQPVVNREAPAETQSEAPAERAPEPQAPPEEAVVASTPVQTPEPEASPTGMWSVQLGSFSDPDNADRKAAELASQGFRAFRSQVTTANGEMHRVRVGPQKDRAAAEEMAEQLQRAGHNGKVVPHD